MKRIVIFGSGKGSNAENICRYFADSTCVKVVFICTNNNDGDIVTRAKKLNIPLYYITKKELQDFEKIYNLLSSYKVDYIILAGFLLKIPSKMVSFYTKKIINIHPSLLPKYGGRGMYGKNVHLAVLKNHENKSGITIHFVNERYDDGEIILQKSCVISTNETVNSLQKKIHVLEFKYFPKTIEKILLK